ncbi:hypothetical protein TSUD_188240 [Trifolium subterraneum]|uniref:Uncharacterized protein n=1 Tax=Trifolium subterraneum TaxID=3900 RepID=A0A2Z6PC81_TRISU|nr:hypothetical protein TSUD_188240 [Trifolium subterraneum]
MHYSVRLRSPFEALIYPNDYGCGNRIKSGTVGYAMMLMGSLSLIGFPFLTGFYSKDVRIREKVTARLAVSQAVLKDFSLTYLLPSSRAIACKVQHKGLGDLDACLK